MHTECLGITECVHNDLAIYSHESLKETEMPWDYVYVYIYCNTNFLLHAVPTILAEYYHACVICLCLSTYCAVVFLNTCPIIQIFIFALVCFQQSLMNL